jgi:hypothetical protein
VEFVDAIALRLEANGLGTLYSTSGTSIQVRSRRDTGADQVILLRPTGGLEFERKTTETYAIQCLAESATASGANVLARQVWTDLHDITREVISGFNVLWMRALAPPQDLGAGPGDQERFLFTVNFDARLIL